MGYDAGILKSESNPKWPLSEEDYDGFVEACKTAHNPKEWMRDSCVWYSRVLTRKLGLKKFKNYVARFDYDNQDVSGDPGKDNGLTNSWLASSLLISPAEQTLFVQKILDNKLGVSKKAYSMTKKIVFREELASDWKLYAKTGMNFYDEKMGLQHGWFVGWIEKDGRKIVFANHIADDKKEDTFASSRAKEEAKNKLRKLIEKLENK
jgi:beta-lactamase class D